jgi:hypothetical protein
LVAEAKHENTVAKSQTGQHSSACSALIATGSCVSRTGHRDKQNRVEYGAYP